MDPNIKRACTEALTYCLNTKKTGRKVFTKNMPDADVIKVMIDLTLRTRPINEADLIAHLVALALADNPNGSEEEFFEALQQLLEAKNASYGNSIAEPVFIFSDMPPGEQIKVRLDDKLSRIAKGKEYPGDNDIIDLIGYLVMKKAINAN